MQHKLFLTLFILVGISIIAACGLGQDTSAPEQLIPNPASVNCEQSGGTLEFRQDAAGGVAGVCKFPDGSEWQRMR